MVRNRVTMTNKEKNKNKNPFTIYLYLLFAHFEVISFLTCEYTRFSSCVFSFRAVREKRRKKTTNAKQVRSTTNYREEKKHTTHFLNVLFICERLVLVTLSLSVSLSNVEI